jgi:enoyl-CoA hydratase
MTFAMLGAFIETLHKAGADPDARVVIITGVPGAFCAGHRPADLASIPGGQRGLRGTAMERGRWWADHRVSETGDLRRRRTRLRHGRRVHVQCDIRIATANARFAWNFAHRGLVPDTGAGSWLLPRLIGPARALKLLYTGLPLSAEEALAIGYVDQLVAPDALQAEARSLAQAILKGSPFLTRAHQVARL